MKSATGQSCANLSPLTQAAVLFAIDPAGLAGIVLKARPGPVRQHWLEQLHALLPEQSPWRKMPAHIGDDELLGGLDLAGTLHSGRPVARQGLLAQCDGGVLLLAMAERIEPGTAARLATTIDTGSVAVERGGLSQSLSARVGMIALDEGIEEGEQVPETLADRFAILLDLDSLSQSTFPEEPSTSVADVARARRQLADVHIDDEQIEVLCKAALGFGIESLRVVSSAVRVARAAAAFDQQEQVTDENLATAAQLVFGSRVRALPQSEEAEPEEQSQQQQQDSEDDPAPDPAEQQSEPTPTDPEDEESASAKTLDDQVLEATVAAIPAQLLQQLQYPKATRGSARSSAKSAAKRRPARRGRMIGTRPGDPADGAQLNLVETLRAAVPWQNVRRAEQASMGRETAAKVQVRKEDFRINRYQQRAATTTVFAVDASGSAALHRLAEAKGAVELLLAESYQRRDSVALVSFRGQSAELLLPPTRSLVRAKRSLAALPGGGGTPLAGGIRLALDTALGIRRKGETPVLIFLTDGSANVTLEGVGNRTQASEEALEAARSLRVEGITSLLIDTSPRPRPAARALADAMAAYYLALPHADARRLSGAAQSVLAGERAA